MYKMLRKEREMSEEEVKNFMLEAKLGRLGMSQNGEPYVIPIGYIYDQKADEIYMHCAKKGRKIDAIKANPTVCFETDEMTRVVVADIPCEYDTIFRSVIAFGTASFVEVPSKKVEAMSRIFEKYAGEAAKVPITEKSVEGTQVIMIKIKSKTGKENKGETIPYPQS
jgi:uncharacterized protein